VQPQGDQPLQITIDGACGEPSMWRRFTEWTDDGVVATLDIVTP
jgi:hypothetical protein